MDNSKNSVNSNLINTIKTKCLKNGQSKLETTRKIKKKVNYLPVAKLWCWESLKLHKVHISKLGIEVHPLQNLKKQTLPDSYFHVVVVGGVHVH